MEKNKEYESAKIELVLFETKDVITTSGYGESKEDDNGWTAITDWA